MSLYKNEAPNIEDENSLLIEKHVLFSIKHTHIRFVNPGDILQKIRLIEIKAKDIQRFIQIKHLAVQATYIIP